MSLENLPVELLYEVQLYALSSSLPLVSRHLYYTFYNSTSTYRAQFLLQKALEHPEGSSFSYVFHNIILKYPICNKDVLEALRRLLPPSDDLPAPLELPRRLFKDLDAKSRDSEREWTDRDPPLPFLRYLYDHGGVTKPPSINSHNGYALTKAVQAKFIPLIRFLLDHGASPALNGNLAVLVAIRAGDLSLVRMLIEGGGGGEEEKNGGAKRRKIQDRVAVDGKLLRAAVKGDARDIVDYLINEKGCVPDLATVHLTRRKWR